jgi:hypothetical protein
VRYLIRSKRWLLFVTIVIICLGANLLFRNPRLFIGGVFRGEKFYHGMPSSYWSIAFREHLDNIETDPYPEIELATEFESEVLDPVKERTGVGTPSYRRFSHPLPSAGRDRNVVPVLIELLKDSDPRVRMWAVRKLSDADGEDQELVEKALMDILDDNGVYERLCHLTVGEQAARILQQIQSKRTQSGTQLFSE